MKKGLALTFLLIAGCANPEKALELGRTQETEKQIAAAIETYEKFLKKWPGHAGAGEATFRVGRLYDRERSDCAKAVPLYEHSARLGGPWGERALAALLSCPDFFPLPPRAKWTFVDTLSGGENMRLEVRIVRSSGGIRGLMKGSFFAGETRFRDDKREVVKEDWGIWEEKDGGRKPILRFPFQKGHSWTASENGSSVRYDVVADGLTVEVKAGKFTGCLKVKSRTAGFPSWVFDYYCPGVGRIKTSVGAPGVENPNTELASYTFPSLPTKNK